MCNFFLQDYNQFGEENVQENGKNKMMGQRWVKKKRKLYKERSIKKIKRKKRPK